MPALLDTIGEAAFTSIGFFWKAGWAFVLGYSISAMIDAFVPKGRLTAFMGDAGPRSIGIATAAGAVSSSCSFAALAAARALIRKGAHWIAGISFMFASTNLVVELGILILIFLGWQFLAAEIAGGLLLIVISAVLVRFTAPRTWLAAARRKLDAEAGPEEDFDWRERVRSRDGWRRVGRRFFAEWRMVWQEILIGFTVAGFMATVVPDSFWRALFLADLVRDGAPTFPIVLENAVVAPFVAAATFIGSMGNIPLAAVLNSGGVLFAGIMGFIYSDLMVPPIIKVNARYYGWRVALYIAGVMFVSIVITAIALHYGFTALDWMPSGGRRVGDITRFAFDYTFWMNVIAALAAGTMAWLGFAGSTPARADRNRWRPGVQDVVTIACASILLIGIGVHLWSSFAGGQS